jgi:hypothetical protein
VRLSSRAGVSILDEQPDLIVVARPARSNTLDVMSVGRKPSPTVVVQPSKISRERRFFDLSFST